MATPKTSLFRPSKPLSKRDLNPWFVTGKRARCDSWSTIVLPRSKSKRIGVDDGLYQYMVTEAGSSADGIVPLTITVQDHATNGARLCITGLKTKREPAERFKYWMERTVTVAVKPRHVAALIKLGMERGWTPTLPGPPFILQTENSDVFDRDNQI
jgi:hypothetical protein